MYICFMSTNNPLFKGSLTTIILKLLSEGERMYGYEITRRVKDLSAGALQLTEGALYPALHRLEADGLVEVSLEYVGNRQRKYYRLTSHGKKETREKLAEVQEFIGQLQLLLNLHPRMR
jgi:PadR family transcriptional regulator PadR